MILVLMNIGALLNMNPTGANPNVAALQLPTATGGFNELLALILGPPGPEPPPGAQPNMGSVELKTNEPNAPSKKLDPAAPNTDALAQLLASLTGTMPTANSGAPIAFPAAQSAKPVAHDGPAPLAAPAKPVIEVNVDAQPLTKSASADSSAATTKEQAALDALVVQPDLGVKMVRIDQTPTTTQVLPASHVGAAAPTSNKPESSALPTAPQPIPAMPTSPNLVAKATPNAAVRVAAEKVAESTATPVGNHLKSTDLTQELTPGSLLDKPKSDESFSDASADDDTSSDQEPKDSAAAQAQSATRPHAANREQAIAPPTDAAPVKDRDAAIAKASDHVERMAALHSRQNVTIHLDPKDVGEITLLIKQSDGQVEAQVNTDNQQVRQAIQNAQSHAVRHWEARGVQVNSITVGELGSTSANKDFSFSQSQHQAQTPMPANHQFSSTAPTGPTVVTSDWTRSSAQGVDLSI